MSSPLLCPYAYRKDGKRGKIYCTVSNFLCAHQFWCNMSVEFKQHTAALDCPGRDEAENGKNREADAV